VRALDAEDVAGEIDEDEEAGEGERGSCEVCMPREAATARDGCCAGATSSAPSSDDDVERVDDVVEGGAPLSAGAESERK